MANQSFQSFGKENVGEFTMANISYFSESGIWLGKILANYVRFAKVSPPKFSAIWYILCVVLESTNLVLLKFIGHLEEYFDIPDWMGLYNRLRMHTIGRL